MRVREASLFHTHSSACRVSPGQALGGREGGQPLTKRERETRALPEHGCTRVSLGEANMPLTRVLLASNQQRDPVLAAAADEKTQTVQLASTRIGTRSSRKGDINEPAPSLLFPKRNENAKTMTAELQKKITMTTTTVLLLSVQPSREEEMRDRVAGTHSSMRASSTPSYTHLPCPSLSPPLLRSVTESWRWADPVAHKPDHYTAPFGDLALRLPASASAPSASGCGCCCDMITNCCHRQAKRVTSTTDKSSTVIAPSIRSSCSM